MIFGTPPANSAISDLAVAWNHTIRDRVRDALHDQAVYIKRPEHEARRPW